MTLLPGRANTFPYKFVKMRIWLASATVIVLILLLALTVNNAREKEMADLFSRQQMASAQNAAVRMTKIFANVGKNIALFSFFDPQGKILQHNHNAESAISYSGWEPSVNAMILYDSEGTILYVLPRALCPI